MRRPIRLALRALFLALAALLAAPVLYAVTAFGLALWPVAGPIPASPPTQAAGGAPIPVHIVSNGFHADIVMPIRSPAVDWVAELTPWPFPDIDPAMASHIGFGWGDGDFYMATAEIDDLRLLPALRALFASRGSVMHVTLWGGAPVPGNGVRRFDLTPGQLAAVVRGIAAGFARDAGGRPIHIGFGYAPADTFFEGVGRYSLVLTCNEWAARVLRAAGLPMPLWTPFAFGLTDVLGVAGGPARRGRAASPPLRRAHGRRATARLIPPDASARRPGAPRSGRFASGCARPCGERQGGGEDCRRSVAQLVERRSPKPKVGGSRPSTPATPAPAMATGQSPPRIAAP